MKLRIARKILLFAARGFEGMNSRQKRREARVRWSKKTIDRAFNRLGPEWQSDKRSKRSGSDSDE